MLQHILPYAAEFQWLSPANKDLSSPQGSALPVPKVANETQPGPLWNSSSLLGGFCFKEHHSERKLNFKGCQCCKIPFSLAWHRIEFRIRNPILQHKYRPHSHKDCRHMWFLTNMRKVLFLFKIWVGVVQMTLILWSFVLRTQLFYESHENGF